MKINFKTKEYAPEQFEIALNGYLLSKTISNKMAHRIYGIAFANENPIRVIRELLFPKAKTGHYFTIIKTYPEKERQWLNQTFQGFCNYKQALEFLKFEKTKAMDGAQFKIKVKMIG